MQQTGEIEKMEKIGFFIVCLFSSIFWIWGAFSSVVGLDGVTLTHAPHWGGPVVVRTGDPLSFCACHQAILPTLERGSAAPLKGVLPQ